jgi:hypothetical protein
MWTVTADGSMEKRTHDEYTYRVTWNGRRWTASVIEPGGHFRAIHSDGDSMCDAELACDRECRGY